MKSTLGSRLAIDRTTSTTRGIPPSTVVTAQTVIPMIDDTSHTRSR